MPPFEPFLKPLIKSGEYSVKPLAGDASTRRYYRIEGNQQSWILMEWEPFEESPPFPFLSVQKYFKEKGIRVPTIQHYDRSEGLFLLEDLGDMTLERRFWEFQDQEDVLPFYKKALDELIKIHSLSFEPGSSPICTAYELEFSVEKLMGELNGAKKSLLQGLLGMKMSNHQESLLEKEFLSLCEELYQAPQVICHRDFHSRNIMIKGGEVAIIDFQDARMGPPMYDLVSLFHDSYVNLNHQSIDLMMDYYKNQLPPLKPLSPDEWDRFFLLQTIQRCFKACGSFASFKMDRDDHRYLHYIPGTLRLVLSQLTLWQPQSLWAELINETSQGWEKL